MLTSGLRAGVQTPSAASVAFSLSAGPITPEICDGSDTANNCLTRIQPVVFAATSISVQAEDVPWQPTSALYLKYLTICL